MNKEALSVVDTFKMALEALKWATSCISFDDFDDMPEALAKLNKAHQTIAAIEGTLAQQSNEQGCEHCNHPLYCGTKCKNCGKQSNEQLELECYDAGLLGSGGGGDVDWWQDYIRAELGRAHDFYQSQVDTHPAVPYVVEPRTAQPKQEPKKDLMFATVAMQEREDKRIENIVATLEKIKQEQLAEKAQPKEPEQRSVSEHLKPVAVLFEDGSIVKYEDLEFVPEKSGQRVQMLYTTPYVAMPRPQRKPLTDEEAMDAYCKTTPFGTYAEAFIAGIRFIEAKLKEKNT